MKWLTVMLMSMATFGALAQDQVGRRGWFVALEAGYGHLDQSDVDDSFDWDETGTAVTLSGGYQFNPYFGVEMGYMRFEEMEVGTADYHLTLAPEGVRAMVFGRFPAGDFAIKGKVGYFDNREDGEVVIGNDTFEPSVDGGFAYELGVEYRVAPRWNLTLSGGKYDLDGITVWGPDREVFTVQGGVRYRF